MAAANPAKMQEMKHLMFAEFAKYQVLLLDASVATRMVTPRPSMSGGRTVFTNSGRPVTGIPRGTAPSVLNTSYTITADIEVPRGSAEGMIATDGGRFGGSGPGVVESSEAVLAEKATVVEASIRAKATAVDLPVVAPAKCIFIQAAVRVRNKSRMIGASATLGRFNRAGSIRPIPRLPAGRRLR